MAIDVTKLASPAAGDAAGQRRPPSSPFEEVNRRQNVSLGREGNDLGPAAPPALGAGGDHFLPRRGSMSGPRALRVFLASSHADVEELIRGEGHQVHAAYDAEWAVAAARALSLDVAIVDMEECDNAFILAQRIRDVAPRHKPMFIGLTGSGGDGYEDHCRAVGIDLLLFKPVQVELLAGLLRRLGTVLDDYLPFDPVI
jgi:CheY-like chemotaxis protein